MTKNRNSNSVFIGINTMMDPAVAAVRDGKILAYSEEERHVRVKHAAGLYPVRALQYCLDVAGCRMEDVAAVAINWDLDAYTDGRMKSFFETMRQRYPVDEGTIAWQNSRLRIRNRETYSRSHLFEWRRIFGDINFPSIEPLPHHYTHAFHAFTQSPFEEAVCLTIDGSGDQHCTVIWRCEGDQIEPIREFTMPHSLGWVYAALTEYLGFRAYDGEYKLMGMAAFGGPDPKLRERVARILKLSDDGSGYEVDATYIHYGPHNHSTRYTDQLVELFGRPPRRSDETFEKWHENLAYAVQEALEEAVIQMVRWAIAETGLRKICIGGGVGLNVKMNSRVFELAEVEDVFTHPLCGDAGAAAGAALLACYQHTGSRPEPLATLALGHQEASEDIENALKRAGLEYEKPADLCATVADELAQGRIVAWVQGRMEAGPRALGHRSILADPRNAENRDKVNAIIKFREYWRPFCPSVMAEHMPRYFDAYTEAPFMIISFKANERLKEDAPAIVHVDGTSRVQMVHKQVNPLYHGLLEAFNERTGVPVLLNTSFNVKGEPIVCSVLDSLRTFWSTGLEVLAVGDFVVRKPVLD